MLDPRGPAAAIDRQLERAPPEGIGDLDDVLRAVPVVVQVAPDTRVELSNWPAVS